LLLNYTQITDAGISKLEELEKLRELALIRTRVTDKSMAIVGRLTQLVELNLDYTDVGDKGIESLRGLQSLECLSLDSANVTDESANVLVEFRQLKELNLYHTLCTEKGYERIRAMTPECRILWDPGSRDPKRRRS
jgi:hypothetical protein